MGEQKDSATLTVAELAKYLNIGINAAYRLVKQPGFPSIKMGEKRYLIPVKAIDKWMEEQAGKTVSLEVE